VWLWQNSRRPPLQLRQWPQVTWPFAGDTLADLQALHAAAERGDLAHELVADHHRHRDGGLRPRVPVMDVQVGAADAVLRTRISTSPSPGSGSGTSCIQSPGSACAFTNAFMTMTPISVPTFVNAATAVSMSASVWAADIWVRMRALPWGTTGKLNAIT
jgi:hypothetical protein